MSKAVVFLISMLILVQFTGCSETSKTYNLASGSPGGNYYPIGGAIAQMWSDQLEDTQINSYSTNASVANCELLATGDAHIALVQNNVAYWAFTGEDIFKDNGNDGLRGIGSLYPEAIQLVTLQSANYTSFEDLLGKKINIGLEGSGMYHDAVNIIEAYGYTLYDFEVKNYAFSQASSLLEQGTIDAAFITAGYPTRSVIDIDLKAKIHIVPIDNRIIEYLMLTSPYYTRTIIPGGTYSSEEEDVTTVSTMAMLCTTNEMDEDLVYEMTKLIWENLDELSLNTQIDTLISFDTSLEGMGIPLHEGAIRYYDEIQKHQD